jgi:hypothetical protein
LWSLRVLSSALLKRSNHSLFWACSHFKVSSAVLPIPLDKAIDSRLATVVTSMLASMKRISENLRGQYEYQAHPKTENDVPLVLLALCDKLVCNLCLSSTSKSIKKVYMAFPGGP